jgi:hypothetical protein
MQNETELDTALGAMGIEETLKLLDILRGNVLELFEIDFEKVAAELGDIDTVEGMELFKEVTMLIIEIMSKVKVFGLAKTLSLHSK